MNFITVKLWEKHVDLCEKRNLYELGIFLPRIWSKFKYWIFLGFYEEVSENYLKKWTSTDMKWMHFIAGFEPRPLQNLDHFHPIAQTFQ